jgi:hypothetical protein
MCRRVRIGGEKETVHSLGSTAFELPLPARSPYLLPSDKAEFAMLAPKACHFQIQGRDHLTVLQDPKYRMIIKALLNHVNGL